jgi:Glyoxalase-like domain
VPPTLGKHYTTDAGREGVAVERVTDRNSRDAPLGASLLDAGDAKRNWRVFADPAGHPFCLVGE